MTGPEAHLPPHLLERRDRARAHVDEFVGLTATEAQRLADELDLPIKLLRPQAVISMEAMFGRINLTLDDDDRVTGATVAG